MLAHTNVVMQRESSPLTGSIWTEIPAAAAEAGDADATRTHAMIDTRMSSAKGEKRHGHASCALRHPNFDCGTTILRMKATSASAYRQIKWAALTLYMPYGG